MRAFPDRGDHIGTELFDLSVESTVHGRADDVDHRIARKDIGNQFPHQRGIIDDENLERDRSCDGLKWDSAREARENGGDIQDQDHVPSPRMEAPLTKSLATMSEAEL
jgi:hypothetical protein